MGRKNNNAGQPNRQAQMSRRVNRRTENVLHRPFKKDNAIERSMAAHPAGKGRAPAEVIDISAYRVTKAVRV